MSSIVLAEIVIWLSVSFIILVMLLGLVIGGEVVADNLSDDLKEVEKINNNRKLNN